MKPLFRWLWEFTPPYRNLALYAEISKRSFLRRLFVILVVSLHCERRKQDVHFPGAPTRSTLPAPA
jgi:hypothetical protein